MGAFRVEGMTTRTKTTKDKEMNKFGNWIVTADIDGLTYAFRMFGCTAQQAVFCLRRKYRNAKNVKVEKSIIKGDCELA